MPKVDLPPGWVHQAYRFEIDRPGRHPAIASHEGARRFAWNWALSLIEAQLQARSAYRLLALRQGATMSEAEAWARSMAPVPWSKAQLRRIWNEGKHLATARSDEERTAAGEVIEARKVYETLAIRQGASAAEARRFGDRRLPGLGWWAENSKEAYSSAFESLEAAFKAHFDSRSGKRQGAPVGWPRFKGRAGRGSVSFTTGPIGVLDRHHVQLPVVGRLRVKEPTDKLRLRLANCSARILRASLVSEGARTYVSFSVIAERHRAAPRSQGVCGHDVGIAALVTGSDGAVTQNPRSAEAAQKRISRYQRRMDRQHRAASPACFNSDGTHVAGTCHWKERSRRAQKNRARLARAHGRARDIRRDALHKATHRAVSTYALHVVEDLNVSGMGRRGRGKRGFNRAARDAALGEYRRQLAYKCPWYGAWLWLASTWFPSSLTCSSCRAKKERLSRRARVFRCDACGTEMDRDLNAAKNLAALAELACVCLMAQMATGIPVYWSKLPIRPYGWEPDRDTRSSRGCARARGLRAEGGERKTARAGRGGDSSFDREAAEPPVSTEAHMSKVA